MSLALPSIECCPDYGPWDWKQNLRPACPFCGVSINAVSKLYLNRIEDGDIVSIDNINEDINK